MSSPLLGVVALAALPLVAFTSNRFSKRVREAIADLQRERGALAGVVEETISGVRAVKGFGTEPVMEERLGGSADAVLGEADKGFDLLEKVLDRARAGLAAEMLGSAAQAFDVPMIGILGTVADYSDPAAYAKSAERAHRFGFSGGTCIHPGLVDALNTAFTPTAEDVAYAQKLVQADAKAASEGRGSFQVDGKMIDIPVIERARKLIARADAIQRRLQRK